MTDEEIQSIAEADPDYTPNGCGFSCGPDLVVAAIILLAVAIGYGFQRRG